MKLSPASLLHKALLAVCVTLLPIIITFTHSYRENRDFLKNNILDDLTVMAEAYEGQVYQFLEMSKRRMQDFASDDNIKKGAKEASSGGLAAGKSLSRYIIKNKLPHDNLITHISIASPKGRIAASTRETSIGKDISGEDYFIKGRDGLTVKEMGKDRNGGPELAVSAPILGDDGELIGVLSGFIRLDYLNDILSGEFNRRLGAISWSKGKRKTMEVYLVNRDRLMITESMFIKGAVLEKKVDSLPVKECLDLGKEVSAFYENYRSIEVAGASMCMPSLGWTILAEVDAEEALASVTEMRWEAISAAFIVAGFIAVLFTIFYNVIIARLRLISGAAASIAGGDYDVAIPVKSRDEIGALSDSFNRMAREIERRDKLLRENEERQRAIIDNSTALIFMKDRDGRYMLVNRRVEEVFSLKAEEIIGKTDHELFPKELADNYRQNDKRVFETGLPIEAEERAAQNDGIHYYISVKVPVFGPKGTPFAICCIATDITERKKTEQARLESEKGLKRVQEIARMGSWEWDIVKDSIVLTDELYRIFGLTPGSTMAFEDFVKSVHPEDAESVQKSINEALYDKKPYSAEFRIIRPDKSMRVLRAEGEASYNEEGGPVRMFGIAQDITERRRSEEALRKSEENYRTLISNIPDVTWTADSRGRVVYISPNIEKVCGYTRQEVYSDDRIWLDNIHPADLDRIIASFGALFTGFSSFNEEYRLRRKDGQWVWVYDRATAAYERDGVKYADGIFSDITDRKLAEEKVTRLNRLFSVLSKINEAIVRIRDTGRLYEEACRIAVEEGRFLLAWVGVIDPDTLFVKCVSSHGDGCGYTEGIRISVREDLPEGQGPTGTALREGRFFICNSIETDPRMAPWRDKALGCGFRSSAALPLRIGGRTAGVINLYSGEPDMFDGEEIKLLEALAADISFAIETIEAERQGRLAEAARVEAQQRYEELVNNLTVGIYRNIELDGGHFAEVNSTAISMLDFSSKEEILKYGVSDFLVDKNKKLELREKLRRQGFVKCEEMEIQTLKGRRLWASITAVMKRDKSGEAYSDG
ncbi:MAG: PAS domain S-box protein, partial [Deltaproteobacteria bacterium]|nr:PAS domain S-box protein [Deltaproteobacteria bacterium]